MAALAAANLFPIAGIAFFNWRGESVIALYLFEAFVVYLVTARMLAVMEQHDESLAVVKRFLFRYGLGLIMMGIIWFGFLGGRTASMAREFSDRGLQIAAAVFIAGHLVGYWKDFIGNKEYERVRWKEVEARMLVYYMVLVVVPFMMAGLMMSESPAVVASILVMMKTTLSLAAYSRERARAQDADDVEQAKATRTLGEKP